MNKDFDKIDDLAHDAFHDFEVDYNPEDWKLMEAKLDNKEHRLSHIWLYKGIEALLLVMILFTAVNFWTLQEDSDRSLADVDTADNEYINLPKTNESKDLKNVNNNSETNKNTVVTEVNREVTKSEDAKNVTRENINSNSNVNNLEENKIINNSNNNNKAIASSTIAKVNKIETSKSYTENSLENSSTENHTTSFNDKNSAYTNSIERNNTTLDETVNLLDETENNLLAENNIQLFSNNSAVFITPVDITKTQILDNNGGGKKEGNVVSLGGNFKLPKIYHRQLRLGIYAGADMNLKTSMGDARLGMAFGMFLENEISDRFAIRGGVVIARKNYENSYVQMIDRRSTEGIIYKSDVYKKTSLGTIQIPVALNVIAFRDNKWKLSFNAGVAAQLLTHRYVSGSQRTTVYQQSGGMVSVAEINPDAQEKGAWQNGRLANNAYFVGVVGVELERRLGDRVSLFLQPVYQHDFTPVGNARDFIHAISLNVGLKTIVK